MEWIFPLLVFLENGDVNVEREQRLNKVAYQEEVLWCVTDYLDIATRWTCVVVDDNGRAKWVRLMIGGGV